MARWGILGLDAGCLGMLREAAMDGNDVRRNVWLDGVVGLATTQGPDMST